MLLTFFRPLIRLFIYSPLLLAALLLSASSVFAQTTSPTDGSTPLGLSPGSPSGSHALSGFESVNPYNGNLNFHLPLIGVGGRGGAAMSSMLAIDTKGWTVRHQETTDLQGNPVDIYTPVANPWVPKAGYGPGVLVGRQSGVDPNQVCGTNHKIYQQTLTRLTFSTSDGTEYEFRDQASGGQPATVSSPCGSGYSRGTVFVTADGTAATFISDSTIYDKNSSTGGSMIFPSGYLLLRDGSRYRIDSGAVTWMRDRNGNKLSFSTSGSTIIITDSLNRQVTIIPADFVNMFSDQITVKGFGGATRTILVTYAQLTNVLRTTNPRGESSGRYQLQTYHQLFPELNNASSYSTWNPWVVASVTLPNNQQYQFSYNCFAELARVNLPTSGAIEYDYTAGSGAVTDYTDYHIYRRVKERRVYPDGSNLESYTTYSESGNPVTVDQYAANGTRLSREMHYFTGDPVASLFNATGISYTAKLDGREYKAEAYAADGTTLLRRTETTWANRANVSWWWSPGDSSEPPNDPRVTDTTSTLADVAPNLVSKKTFGYDDSLPFNNQNDVREYAFGNGSPGSLVRETTTSFVTSNTYTGTSVHLRSLPSQVSVLDAGGVERARTTYEYDNYTLDGSDCSHSHHCPLLPRSNISGLDASFDASYTTRGNATSSTSYLMTNGSVTSSISGYTQYDIAGNAWQAIDALENRASFGFADNYGTPDGTLTNSSPTELSSVGQTSYAMATSVTNAANQTSYLQYDFYLGRPVDAQDVNGTIYTGYSDNDSLDRPTKVVRAFNYSALKSQSTFSYDDTNRTVTVTSDKDAYGDNLLKGQTLYDGLGRTVESRTYVNSTDYIAVQSVPFSLEQDPDTNAWVAATKSTNPFSPQLSESAVWNTTFTDALGRATKGRTPDGAIVRTSYSGNTVTVSDQTGKSRKSATDALGRMIEVVEDPSGANWSTTYAYDVLNNLLTISQGSQTRTFVYDSLKRLSSTTNPENGSISYQYDNGGNLLVKTDARGVSTHVSYDVLNRPVRRWYNGSSSATATTNNSPALPSGVSTSDEASFWYDSQTLPSGAPSFSRGYATGRAVAVTYGTNSSAGDYFGYDALGRAVVKIQQTGGVNYQTTASYGVNGSLTSETYPSNHTVSYAYDGAGRASSFSGNLGDGGAQRTYSTGIVYSSLGGMTKEQFGTDTAIYNKLFYNVGGQLSEIRESSSYTGPTDTTWNRGAIINHYSNNCWGMCGGSNSTTAMTDNNGNLKKQEVYIPNDDSSYTTWWQRYDYDNVNRLSQVTELSGSTALWQQAYTLDRYGNRTIDYNNTSSSMPRPQFGVDTTTNRLTVPTGYTMSYDGAGNLTNDTYSGQGQRNYDAENRMTQAWSNSQWQTYAYDGGGQRIKRNAYGVETWMVYGLGGALIAEYAPNAAATSPQKEYGYRNGQLLITADVINSPPPPVFSDDFNSTSLDTTKWSVADPNSSGVVSDNGQQLQITLQPNTAAYNGVYSNATYDLTGKTVQVEEVQPISQAGWCENFFEAAVDGNNYVLIDSGAGSLVLRSMVGGVNNQTVLTFDQTAHHYWRLRHDQNANTINFETSADNTTWTTRKTAAVGFSLTAMRFYLYAGAWGTGNSNPGAAKYDNFQLLANAPSPGNAGFETPALGAGGYQYGPTGGSWTFAGGGGISGNSSAFTSGNPAAPEGVQVAFLQTTGVISESVTGFQANINYVVTFAGAQRGNWNQGGQDFQVYLDNTLLGTFRPTGTSYGNYSTAPFTTTAGTHTLKFVGLNSSGGDNTAFIDNVGISGSVTTANLRWLVTDQLGTPRMAFDKSGALATTSRHDYLPFGEELFANTGSRTTTQGYTAAGYNPADKARQKFTGYESDVETGLNFAQARYNSSMQGRFTSADTFGGSVGDPQSLNRYAYVANNPMNLSDPSGHMPSIHLNPKPWDDGGYEGGGYSWDDPTSPQAVLLAYTGTSAAIEAQQIELYSRELNAVHFGQWLQSLTPAGGSFTQQTTNVRIAFTNVSLLDSNGNPIQDAKSSEYGDPNRFNLDVDNASGPDPNSEAFLVKISFSVISGNKRKEATLDQDPTHENNKVTTSNEAQRRWQLIAETRTGQQYPQFDIASTRGSVTFMVKQKDPEAKLNNMIKVTVGANYQKDKFGPFSTPAYIQATAQIRLLIGPRDR